MALEDLTGSSVFINDLDENNPVGSTDKVRTLDDHIQGIKNVLKNTFSGITGEVTATQVELNLLHGKTSIATLGANTFTDSQAITADNVALNVTSILSYGFIRLLSPAGAGSYYETWIDGVRRGILRTDASDNITKLSHSNSSSVEKAVIDLTDAGVVNVSTGILQYAGVEVATVNDISSFITASGVTFAALNATSSVGTGATQVAQGNHLHAGVYEPANSHLTKDNVAADFTAGLKKNGVDVATTADIVAGTVSHAYKSVDESVTSSTALQDDDDLNIAVSANKRYAFEFFLVAYSVSSTPGIRYSLSTPSGSVYRGTGTEVASTVTAGGVYGLSPVRQLSLSALVVTYIHFRGVVAIAGTAGNVKVQWAQNVSNATATQVWASSYLTLTQLD